MLWYIHACRMHTNSCMYTEHCIYCSRLLLLCINAALIRYVYGTDYIHTYIIIIKYNN